MCLRLNYIPHYENRVPRKVCNQTKMTLKPFDWHLEMEKKHLPMTAGTESCEPVGKPWSLPVFSCCWPAHKNSWICVPEERNSVFGMSVSRDNVKYWWFSRVLNVHVIGKCASLDREWSAKTSCESRHYEPQQQCVTPHTQSFHFQSTLSSSFSMVRICSFSLLIIVNGIFLNFGLLVKTKEDIWR